MLVLSRKKNESIVINGDIRIEVLQIKGKQIRLGITAPSSMKVLRGELPQRVKAVEEQAGEITFEATIPYEVAASENGQDDSSQPNRIPGSPQNQLSESSLHNWVTAVMAAN